MIQNIQRALLYCFLTCVPILNGMEQTAQNAKKWNGKIYGRPSKHDEIAVDILDTIDLTKCKTILHIGCGTGAVTAVIGKRVSMGTKVIGIDSSPQMIKQAKEKYKLEIHMSFLPEDITTFEPAKKADLIVSLGCLHRCKDQIYAFKKMYEYLNNPGRLIITLAPTRKGLSKTDFEGMLSKIGFTKINSKIVESDTKSAFITHAFKA